MRAPASAFTILALTLAAPALAAPAVTAPVQPSGIPEPIPGLAPGAPRCVITIENKSPGGRKKTDEIVLPANSAAECQKLAAPYRTNFDEKHVKTKSVKSRWIGPPKKPLPR